MRLLADMGVDVRVVDWLRSQGHDATHLRDEGLQRLPNGEIFVKAVAESRVILTFDLDFGEILALSKGQQRTQGWCYFVSVAQHEDTPRDSASIIGPFGLCRAS